MADLIVNKILKQERFTWGRANLVPANDARKKYLEALKAADQSNFKNLLQFARS
jgi:hypothetical protein